MRAAAGALGDVPAGAAPGAFYRGRERGRDGAGAEQADRRQRQQLSGAAARRRAVATDRPGHRRGLPERRRHARTAVASALERPRSRRDADAIPPDSPPQTRVRQVFDGRPLFSAARSAPVAGASVNARLRALLLEQAEVVAPDGRTSRLSALGAAAEGAPVTPPPKAWPLPLIIALRQLWLVCCRLVDVGDTGGNQVRRRHRRAKVGPVVAAVPRCVHALTHGPPAVTPACPITGRTCRRWKSRLQRASASGCPQRSRRAPWRTSLTATRTTGPSRRPCWRAS